MKHIHLVIQIAIGIILAQGFIGQLFIIENHYTGKQFNLEYAWPVVLYFAVLLMVAIIKEVHKDGTEETKTTRHWHQAK